MIKNYHYALSIEFALSAWEEEQFREAFVKNDGCFATPEEAKKHLEELLKSGSKVIPLGNECQNFDPVIGCPGHSPMEAYHAL